jgi:hypothetical protein
MDFGRYAVADETARQGVGGFLSDKVRIVIGEDVDPSHAGGRVEISQRAVGMGSRLISIPLLCLTRKRWRPF